MAGTLYIVATPIGNLGDITLRAKQTLERADVVCAEDTRRTLALLNSLGIKNRLISFHEYSDEARLNEIIGLLEEGKEVALCSDAGTPLISDPGARLVDTAHNRGIRVSPVPGASSVTAALSACGMGDEFTFFGFIPKSGTPRSAMLEEVAASPRLSVLLESPMRLSRTLEDLAALAPGRVCAVCRELTKVYEEIARGPIEEMALKFSAGAKGEAVIIVSGAQKKEADDELIARTLDEFAKMGAKSKEAVEKTASKLNVNKNRVKKLWYNRVNL